MVGEPDVDQRADAVELLALVATLADHAFVRFAADAVNAPTAPERLSRSRLAACSVSRRDRVLDRLADLGGDPVVQIVRFDRVLDDFDARTEPATWAERLLRGYVGCAVSEDFCRLAAWGVDVDSRDLVLDVLDDADHVEASVMALCEACADDPALASRLALWGRRVVGESLQTVSRLLAAYPALGRLAARGMSALREVPDGAEDVQPASKVLNELTAEHTRRMSKLSLTA
ncbi:MAG: ferritin-like domain-containing protein [Micrococcales bacterium]|nr:ferritin-like domain-containing protein [Micrococcales bacterium]